MIPQTPSNGVGVKIMGVEALIGDNNPLRNDAVITNKGVKLPTSDPLSKEDNDEEDEDLLGFHFSLLWLGIITVLIALLSDAISASIENAALSVGISRVFLSAIILPIVGNAAEHAGAIMFAAKNRLDLTLGSFNYHRIFVDYSLFSFMLSLGIAVGSSTQIALMVLPFLVLIGWMINEDLTLDFGSYESLTMFLTVVLVTFVIQSERSYWMLGVILISAYIIISIGFWVHQDENL